MSFSVSLTVTSFKATQQPLSHNGNKGFPSFPVTYLSSKPQESVDESWVAPRRKAWHRWKRPRIKQTRKMSLDRRRERRRQLSKRDQRDSRAPISPTQSFSLRFKSWERSHLSQ